MVPKSSIRSRWRRWREDRKLFPIRWLTYKRRVLIDLESAFASEGAKEWILNEQYVSQLGAAAKEADVWLLKLMSIQAAVTVFVFLGLTNPQSSISLFGVSLSNVPGIKEVLLVASVTLGLISSFISFSRDTLRIVAEAVLQRLVHDGSVAKFAKLAIPAAFNVWTYFPAEYNQYIFSTLLRRVSTLVITASLVTVAVLFLGASFFVSWRLFHDIWTEPMMGAWSKWCLIYSICAFSASGLMLLRFHLPMPYRDKSELKVIEKLQKTDAREAARRSHALFAKLKK